MSYCRAWDPSHWSHSQVQRQFQWSEMEFEKTTTYNKQTNKNKKKNSIMHWVYYLLFFLGYWFISLWVSCVWAAIHSRIRTNKPSKEETQIQLASWSSTLQVGHQHAHSLYWFPLSKCQAFSGCIYIIMHPWFLLGSFMKKFSFSLGDYCKICPWYKIIWIALNKKQLFSQVEVASGGNLASREAER